MTPKTAPAPAAVGEDRPAVGAEAGAAAASAKKWISMKKTSKTYLSSRYIKYKTCKWCGHTKEFSEFYEGRWGKKCKVCVRARAQQYRREHLQQYAEYDRARANLPQRVEARRRYQLEHEEEISEYKKRWAADNEEKVASSRLAYYERNRAEVIARSKEWAEDNPEKVRQAKADNRRKRRTAKHASLGSFTAEEFRALCEGYGNRCLACGDAECALEADHVVPLTKGGSDDIGNIQPLCGSCNRKKLVNIIDYRLGAVGLS